MRLRVFISVLVLFSFAAELSIAGSYKGSRWVKYWDSQFGFVVQYPGSVFEPLDFIRSDTDQGGEKNPRFISKDGEALIWVWGELNTENLSMPDYRAYVTRKAKKIGTITYKPNGDTWFVLSGYKQDRVFYRKVILSCHGYVINSLHIEFPKSLRKLYEPIVEGMENHFRPGRGNFTPVDC